MMKRALITLFLAVSLQVHAFVDINDRWTMLSDCTEVVLPVLGFASILVNSDLAKGKHGSPSEIGFGYVSEKDAKSVGRSLLRLASSFAHVTFYKQWVNEKRPNQGREHKFFALPELVHPSEFTSGPVFYGFPSSHASKMFFGAATIHKEFGFKVASPFYALGAACSAIRLYRDNHFIHDLIAGAMIGAKLAFSNDIVNFIPTPIKNGGAVNISISF